jgi:hypothetical protein
MILFQKIKRWLKNTDDITPSKEILEERIKNLVKVHSLIHKFLDEDDFDAARNCLKTNILPIEPVWMDILHQTIDDHRDKWLKYGEKSEWCSDPDLEKIRRAIIDKA